MSFDLSILERGCEEWNVPLSSFQKEQFIQYYELLIKWNEVMNLTAITKWEEVLLKHFVDSLSITKVMNMNKVDSLIDVGTGAGFPGIPVKIMFPHIKVTLLDSLNKRLEFLRKVCEDLKLGNVDIIHGRAEDIARKKEYREKFALSVSRAVSRLATLSEYCLPFVEKGGCFISYKSGNLHEEIKDGEAATAALGGEIEQAAKFLLPDTNMERTLVLIRKIAYTPEKYPRKAGIPAKEPILCKPKEKIK